MRVKIKLDKHGGPVVFLGSTNAMPMMYALELKNRGYDVLYFVDAPKSDALNRPESHFGSISYPYPSWIIEFELRGKFRMPFFSFIYAKLIERNISKVTQKPVQLYILNDLFVALAPSLEPGAKKIALSHGSDLDVMADCDGVEDLVSVNKKFTKLNLFPLAVIRKLLSFVVCKQFDGFKCCDLIIYFPRGFSQKGDRVLDRLLALGKQYLPRFDVSFRPLIGQPREFRKSGNKLIVFSGVRFAYQTFLDGNAEYNKGNDIIIRGLAKYYAECKDLEIHFVEKGPDVEAAKRLCVETGLDEVVVWHKEMKFVELLDLYRQADICFDQVGPHWIGAVGAYALWLGKPLIANDYLFVRNGIWPRDNPVCSADSVNGVCEQIKKLSNPVFREEVSEISKVFAEKYLGPDCVLDAIFD